MRSRWRYLAAAFIAGTAIAVLVRGQGAETSRAEPTPALSDAADPVSPDSAPPTGLQEAEADPVAPLRDLDDAADSFSPLTDRSIDGAVSAAIFFLELSEEVVQMTPIEGATIQRRYATAATADSSAAELSAQLEELRAAAGPGMSLDVAPISWMVSEVEPQTEYAISIWYVEVFSLGGPTDAFGAFKIYSAEVRWEDGSWRLGDAEVFAGPEPVVSSEQAASGLELRAELAGFSDGGRLVPLLIALQGDGER